MGRAAPRAAATNSRKGPRTTTLRSDQFRLRWRDRTLVSGALSCWPGFSTGYTPSRCEVGGQRARPRSIGKVRKAYGKSRPRPAAANSRKGPRTTTLRSDRFRLRWRDRTLVSDGFFCLLGFSLGKRRSKKSWSKTRTFHPGSDPPQHRDRGY